ncbi:MAG: hypothetical protein BMS9Abin12_1755 [Acidimicrobiia bacterium]|nr:MAG: hypothetical protein BMS9Abin12_1755 [Acidimicrobiia bacterium]
MVVIVADDLPSREGLVDLYASVGYADVTEVEKLHAFARFDNT